MLATRGCNVAVMTGGLNPEWRSYEELTEDLIRRIGAVDGISTVRLERKVPLTGRATGNEIDVLWEFRDKADRLVRLLFECRSYSRRINQQALHSWRSVVDDVSEAGVEAIGVMVTTTGYQAGAQRVADTYGIVICELRAPTGADLAGRVHSARIEFIARQPKVSDPHVKTTEQLGPDTNINGPLGEFFLDLDDKTSERLGHLLLRGELTSLDEPPTTPHRVTRTFASPVVLRRVDEPIARVWEISATVSEVESGPTTIESRLGPVAWMLANTLTGSHIWFAEDGNAWQTPS
jgi:hypothetical protein